MSRKQKRKQEPPPPETWACPVCGEVEPLGTACSTCETEQVVLPAFEEGAEPETLHRLRGTYATPDEPGEGDQEWRHRFDLTLAHDEEVRIEINPATRVFSDHSGPGPAEVLGRVEVLFQEHERGLRDAPSRRIICRSAMVALGPDANELLTQAIRDAQRAPPAAPDEEDIPERIKVEREEGALVVTMSPDVVDALWNPALILPVGSCVFYGMLMLRGWTRFLHLLIPMGAVVAVLGYVWIALLNRRIIRVDRETISVSFWPIPWPGRSFPVKEVLRLEGSSAEFERPDTLYAVLRDGSAPTLLRNAYGQVRYVESLLEAEIGLWEHEETELERRTRRRSILRRLARWASVIAVVLLLNHTMWPGYSMVLQGAAIREALKQANQCRVVRDHLGGNITWAVAPHWPDRGCGAEDGRLSFAVRGDRDRGVMKVRYEGMGCADASPTHVGVIVGTKYIDAEICIIDHRYSK